MNSLIQGLIEGAVPLIAGSVLTYKLIKSKTNKLFYLGPVLILFGILLVLKSISTAEPTGHPEWVSREVVRKLKGDRIFPTEVDVVTTLDDILPTGNSEVTYIYSVAFDDSSEFDQKPIVDYACRSKDFSLLHQKGFSIVFVYRNKAGKEIDKVVTSAQSCAEK